jgi:hypothetical protein
MSPFFSLSLFLSIRVQKNEKEIEDCVMSKKEEKVTNDY